MAVVELTPETAQHSPLVISPTWNEYYAVQSDLSWRLFTTEAEAAAAAAIFTFAKDGTVGALLNDQGLCVTRENNTISSALSLQECSGDNLQNFSVAVLPRDVLTVKADVSGDAPKLAVKGHALAMAAIVNGATSNILAKFKNDGFGSFSDPSKATISANPDTVNLRTGKTSTVTVQARNTDGRVMYDRGLDVRGATTFGVLSAFSYAGGGKYSATLTATQAGVAEVSFSMNTVRTDPVQVAGSGPTRVTFEADAVEILSPKAGATVYPRKLTFTGSGQPSSVTEVLVGGTRVATTTTNGEGYFSIPNVKSPISITDGPVTFRVVIAGNESSVTVNAVNSSGATNLENAQDSAKSNLANLVANAKAVIEELALLNADEKKAAYSRIDTVATEASGVIEAAKAIAGVNDTIAGAADRIGKIVADATLANAKLAGVKELEVNASEVNGKIDALTEASQAERSKAHADVAKAMAAADAALQEADTLAAANTEVTRGKAAMEKVHADLASKTVDSQNDKGAAKDGLQQSGNDSKKEIDHLPGLSDKDKQDAKEAIDKAVEEGRKAIDDASTAGDVSSALKDADDAVSKILDNATLADAKLAGVKELEAKASEVRSKIETVTGVSTADKNDANTKAKEALDGAAKAVKAANSPNEVSETIKAGKDSMERIYTYLRAASSPTPAPPKVNSSDGTKVSGSAEAGRTITVKNAAGKTVCTTVAAATGTFSCWLKPVLKSGEKLTVTATSIAGKSSTPTTITVNSGALTNNGSASNSVINLRYEKCLVPRKVPAFADTPVSHKFYKHIDWMDCMGFSTGWRQLDGKPLYKPAENLERQAMAAFIYRMEAPSDYQAPVASPFADVDPTDSFYKEMAWMYEKGYSTGWRASSGKPTYRPHESLSREAMAAFVYRLEASKSESVKAYAAPKSSQLADMKPGMKFYKEISWMYDAKLSTGNKVSTTKEYWPKDDLSRQAMAAFIHRLADSRYMK